MRLRRLHEQPCAPGCAAPLRDPAASSSGGGFAGGTRAGQGYGAQLVLEHLGIAHLDAVDLDEGMVALACRRLAGQPGVGRIVTGDAKDLGRALDATDSSYDVVVDFGTLHHLPAWRDGLTEARRVLRPGGTLIFEEVTDQALNR